MKFTERLFEKRLRKVMELHEKQMGFVPGKSTIDAISIMRQMEKMKQWEENFTWLL